MWSYEEVAPYAKPESTKGCYKKSFVITTEAALQRRSWEKVL